MLTDQIRLEIVKIRSAGLEIAKELGRIVPSADATNFYIRIRVKSHDSIEDKILRKRFEEKISDFNVSHVDDIVGMRIVTLYDRDMAAALDFVFKIVDAGRNQALFSGSTNWDSIRQFRIYKPGYPTEDNPYVKHERQILDCIAADIRKLRKNDPNRTKLQAYSKNFKAEQSRLINPNPDYASTHVLLDAYYPDRRVRLRVPIEIQIRTAAEDIWGQIDHQYLYKNKSIYVWSHEMARLYGELKRNSRRLHRAVEVIKECVEDFIDHDRELQRAAVNFHSPSSEYSLSLTVTIFYSISKRMMSQLTNDFAEYHNSLRQFIRVVRGGPDASSPNATCIGALRRCVKALEEIKAKLDATVKDIEGAPNPAELVDQREVCIQRKFLCDFEIARLAIVCAVDYEHSLKGGTDLSGGARRNELQRLYDLLCDYETSTEPKIRPLSVINFFKYFTSRSIHRFDQYMEDLKSANSYLADDQSIPKWSIYYGFIPLTLADELLESVADRESQVSDAGVRVVRDEFRRPLKEAFDFAKTAFEAYLTSHESRTGDLHFGRAPDFDAVYPDKLLTILLHYRDVTRASDAKWMWEDGTISYGEVAEVIAAIREISWSKRGVSDAACASLREKLDKVEAALDKTMASVPNQPRKS
jgi:ppGpp synthetase/RelA/SpoT-type nucleotidyltranferase